jgi:ketosteroid isomerase-like protein
MTEQDVLHVAERFFQAIQSDDADAVRACYAPDAVIWHNNDNVEQSVDKNMRTLGWIMRKLPGRHYRVLRREALQDGFLQQHVLEATLPDGTAWRLPACLVVKVRDGLIVRLDEYLDSAATAPLAALGR